MATAANPKVRNSLAAQVDHLNANSVLSTSRMSVRAVPAPILNSSAAQSDAEQARLMTVFLWKDTQISKQVFLVGSFNGWKQPIPMAKTVSANRNVFAALLELPVGRYTYRFLVDGKWTVCEDDEDIVEDVDGRDSHYLALGVTDEEESANDVAVFCNAVVDAIQFATEKNENGYEQYQLQLKDEQKRIEMRKRLEQNSDAKGRKNTAVVALPRKKTGIAKIFTALFPGLVKEPSTKQIEVEEHLSDYSDCEDDAEYGNDEDAQQDEGPLQVWFPDDQNYPVNGSTVEPKKKKSNKNLGDAPGNNENADPNKDEGDNGLDEFREPRPVPQKPKMTYMDAEQNAWDRQALAGTLYKAGNFDGALAMYGVAIRLRETNGLRMTPNNALCHMELGATLINLEDYASAEKHLKIARSMWQHGGIRFGDGNMEQYADINNFLACALDRQRKRPEAEYYHRKAICVYEKYKLTETENYKLAQDNLELNIKKQIRDGLTPGSFKPKKEKHVETENLSEALRVANDEIDMEKGVQPKPKPVVVAAVAGAGAELVKKPSEKAAKIAKAGSSDGSASVPPPPLPAFLASPNLAAPVAKAPPPTPTTTAPPPPPPPAFLSALSSASPSGAPPPPPPPPPAYLAAGQDKLTTAVIPPPPPAVPAPLPPRAPISAAPVAKQAGPSLERQGSAPRERARVPSMVIKSGMVNNQVNLKQAGAKNTPASFKELADIARASMPKTPPEPVNDGKQRGSDAPGKFDRMAIEWHRDAKLLTKKGSHAEAVDIYTLAVFARKKSAEQWYTPEAAELLLDFADSLRVLKRYGEAESSLVQAIGIIEKTKLPALTYGRVWFLMAQLNDERAIKDKAKRQYMKAIEIFKNEKYQGPELASALKAYIALKQEGAAAPS